MIKEVSMVNVYVFNNIKNTKYITFKKKTQ